MFRVLRLPSVNKANRLFVQQYSSKSKPTHISSKLQRNPNKEEIEQHDQKSEDFTLDPTNNVKRKNTEVHNGDKEKTRKSFFVPQVPSTEYLPREDLETEGLFAGYKPLFLGNSPLESTNNDVLLDGLFSSIRKLKNAQINSENNTVEIDVSDMLEDLKKDNQEYQKLHEKIPKIPWDASISGLVYNDEPFRNVPRSVVSKLKPFKLVRVEKKNTKGKDMTNDKIKLKFHGTRIKDEPTIVDLVQETRKMKDKGSSLDTAGNNASQGNKSKYESERIDYAYKFQFVEADQRIFKNNVSKLTRLFAKEFLKVRNVRLASDFKESYLPLYIYVDNSIQSRVMFRRYLRTTITDYIKPLLVTLSHSYETKDLSKKFEKRVMFKVDAIVNTLSDYLPSVYFKGDEIDCLLLPSPVAGFGRMHWLKQTKRHNVFWGKNVSNDYVFNLNYDVKVTRSGIKRMRYPINLHWKNFNTAFNEWKYSYL
ncbi:unnamed protein product [Kluyveromyces dobzhanskii CBS 2104]|uniref:WGS project CCBQ000000000 data, contig 00107 n=1 Tax=Kluyveromyces dobzhanskii CBS 2104 TaxID=1427455 RepID=A0A0A8KYY7_9SACH|nr:unnamed protein product [Kluyveromyces dobzhanskii CBS 2104]